MTAPQTIRCILTARDSGARLAEMPSLSSGASGDGLPSVRVRTGTTFQVIEGFGGAFTEAAAVTWQRLGSEQRPELLAAYFDAAHGHGYSFCRVHMGSCDFSVGNYSHVETPADLALDSFSIDRDRQALLPFIQAAQRVSAHPLRILASPWSPPAWMKTNGQMNGGGQLRPQCRRAWARCYVRFIEAYAAEGVAIWGVSVQNEPMAAQRWDSCLYSAEEERDFVRDFLGPELESAGLGDVRIVIWDHNRDLMVERANAVYSDPQAARYVWGTGFHWYGDDHFENVQRVHDRWPGKKLLFTEGCQEGGPHHGSWELGERYARSMINDLNRWTVGWIDWNLLLDAGGGPNHVGNFCSAPILADTSTGTFALQSSYYYLGHFSRFVKPGSLRVQCTTGIAQLEAASFVNPDGRSATIVMNRTEQTQRFALELDEMRAAAELPPRSIATYLASE
jgi:glucosylceramidase